MARRHLLQMGSMPIIVVVVCKTDPYAQPAYKGISLLVVEKGMAGFKRGKKLDKIGMH